MQYLIPIIIAIVLILVAQALIARAKKNQLLQIFDGILGKKTKEGRFVTDNQRVQKYYYITVKPSWFSDRIYLLSEDKTTWIYNPYAKKVEE